METGYNDVSVTRSAESKRAVFDDLVDGHFLGFTRRSVRDKEVQIERLTSQGKVVSNFGYGVSPFPPPAGVVNGLRESAHHTAYAPLTGIQEFKQAICKFHSDYDGLDYEPDQVMVGPGSAELLYLLFSAFNGDIMLVSPTWSMYKTQTELTSRKMYIIETRMENDWRVQPEDIERVIEDNDIKGNKLLVIVNPDNPTGTCYRREELEAIGQVCRRNNIIVLSDEMYARFVYDQKHESLALYYPEGTILSSGFSKWAGIAGWRLGYQIFPPALEPLHHVITVLASYSFMCVNTPAQYALVKALKNERDIRCYIQHTSRILGAVSAYCHRELTSVGIECLQPQAGLYIFLDFGVITEALKKRGLETSQQLCDVLFDEAHAMLEGQVVFSKSHKLRVRLAFVNFNGKLVLEESLRIGLDHGVDDGFIKTYCKPLCNGIQAIKTWVHRQLQM